MKRLCKAASLPDAHILRGLLEQEGIEVHVFNENAQSGVGPAAGGGGTAGAVGRR